VIQTAAHGRPLRISGRNGRGAGDDDEDEVRKFHGDKGVWYVER
jgi:hypothetical protein